MKTILDIARLANVSKITVRRYIDKQNIKPHSDGRVFLFDDSVADAIVKGISNGVPIHVPVHENVPIHDSNVPIHVPLEPVHNLDVPVHVSVHDQNVPVHPLNVSVHELVHDDNVSVHVQHVPVQKVRGSVHSEDEPVHVPVHDSLEAVQALIDMLQKELESKDKQIKGLNDHLKESHERLAYEQKLHEHTQILLKQEQDKNVLLLESNLVRTRRKTFFSRWFRRN